MTRKDYALIAKALKAAKPVIPVLTPRMVQWENDCICIADALARDNPAFDKEKFIAVCHG